MPVNLKNWDIFKRYCSQVNMGKWKRRNQDWFLNFDFGNIICNSAIK